MSSISDHQVYRTVAPILLVLTLFLAVGAIVGTYVNDQNDRERDRVRIADNAANAVTGCENANESREANRTLWNTILNLSTAGNQDQTPQEGAYLEAFRDYVDTVFQDHDCQHLDKKYELPDPPTIPGT